MASLWAGIALAEQYQPVRIVPERRVENADGSIQFIPAETLSFPADARLNFDANGTLELSVAIRANSTSRDPMCLLRQGDEARESFAVLMHPARRAIYLRTSQGTATFPFDFSDGEFHHVAFGMSGGLTSVLIDGKSPTMPGDDPTERLPMSARFMPFAAAGPLGLPLTLGCDSETAFDGWIAMMRFWDEPLNPTLLEWARAVRGLPKEDAFGLGRQALQTGLIAYTVFSDKRQTLFYTEPEILSTARQPDTGAAQSLVMLRRAGLAGESGDRSLVAVYAKTTPTRGLDELRFELSGGLGRIPLILPQASDWTPEKQAALEALQKQANDQPTAFFEGIAAKARFLQVGFDQPQKGGLTGWRVMAIATGQSIAGLAGIHDTVGIRALRVRSDLSSGNLSPLLGEARNDASEFFSQELPPFARLEGVSMGQSVLGTVTDVSLLYSMVPVPAAAQPLVALGGKRWVDARGCRPRMNDELAFVKGKIVDSVATPSLHGLFTTPIVAIAKYDSGRRELSWYSDGVSEKDDSIFLDNLGCGFAQTGQRLLERRLFYPPQAGQTVTNLYADQLGSASRLRLQQGGKLVTIVGGKEAFVPVKAYDEPFNEKLPWGGTFTLPHRPANLRSNFVGYDVTRLNPHNFLRSHGIRREVFRFPEDSAADYQTTDNNLIVPHGVFFQSTLTGMESARTIMAAGASEYQKAWSAHLGVNIGFDVAGIGATYSAKFSKGGQTSNRNEREVITAITKTAETRYALVLDRSRVELSDDFKTHVMNARDQYLVDRLQPMNEFINLFGTHYPYAVSYGGMAFLETQFSKEVVDHMEASNMSFEQSTKASFSEASKSNGCGCSGGGGGGPKLELGAEGGFERSKQLKDELRASDESRVFGVYGGSLTRGEGWSLSPGQEVPLFFDLRPLDELLSPLYFDDPIVWEVLQPRLHAAIGAYLANRQAASGAPPSWYSDSRKKILMDKQPSVFGKIK